MKVEKHFPGAPHDSAAGGVRSAVDLLTRCGFDDVVDDRDDERRIATVAARLLGWSNALATGSGGDASAAVQVLRASLRADERASVVFAGACARAGDREFVEALLDEIRRFAHLAKTDPELRASVTTWVSFKEPEKREISDALVPHETEDGGGFAVWQGRAAARRRRDGFALTDRRHGLRQALDEIDHCIYRHDRDTDSCSKGMRNRKDGTYKVNPLGVKITGCPLEEKISEMHVVKRQGDSIGALALIVIDNPMRAGTGHRICNDCMKGCIYQKTEPVDIPQIETNVLTDVLFMPYGFEIYSLLTRWNPLNVRCLFALPITARTPSSWVSGPRATRSRMIG